MHGVLEETKWQFPCGNVPYAKAVHMIVIWTEEHDTLISLSKSPEGIARIKTQLRSEMSKFENENFPSRQKILDQPKIIAGKIINSGLVPINWTSAMEELSEIENLRNPKRPPRGRRLHKVLSD